jgi:hypothetical protein
MRGRTDEGIAQPFAICCDSGPESKVVEARASKLPCP